MEYELVRFRVQPITTHREDGIVVDEEYGQVLDVFTVEQFAELVDALRRLTAERNSQPVPEEAT